MSYTSLQSLTLLIIATAVPIQASDEGEGGATSSEGNDNSGESSDDTMKTIHGILAVLAFVIFFPLGAILIRVINNSKAWWIHASIQCFSLILFIAAAATGIEIAEDGQLSEYHPVIGLVLLGAVLLQALAGIAHHLLFRKLRRRTVVSHMHIWLGRLIVTLGMVNGGLGLLFSEEEETGKYIAYGVVAGMIWLVYVGVAVWSSIWSANVQAHDRVEAKNEVHNGSDHQLLGLNEEGKYR